MLKKVSFSAYVMLFLIALPSAYADERVGKLIGGLGTSAVRWDLTPQQTIVVDKLLADAKAEEQVLNDSIEQKRAEIIKLFLKPTPDESAVFATQDQIDKLTQKRDARLIMTNLRIRALLTPEQRNWMGVPDPSQVLVSIKLSPGQRWSYAVVTRSHLESEQPQSKPRADLVFEQQLLLQEVDLVLGCHAQKLDVPGLFAKQKQISALDAASAKRRLQLAIGLHNILSDEQKQQLRRDAEIKISDPLAVSEQNELKATVPKADAVFEGVSLSGPQKLKYEQIIGAYTRALTQRMKARDYLVAEQKKLISQTKLDETALATTQEKLNAIDVAAGTARMQLVVDTRNVLTSDQRHAVFNRHHPKIWNDTGINVEQDKQLMAYHMKLEEADREGRRKMIDLAQDMMSLYERPVANNDEILALQRRYDQVEADTVRKQLTYLVKNRTVLTDGQRQKLVHLMQITEK